MGQVKDQYSRTLQIHSLPICLMEKAKSFGLTVQNSHQLRINLQCLTAVFLSELFFLSFEPWSLEVL